MPLCLYQFFHPWHWMTYGQNSSALGASAAVIAALAAVAAAIFAVLTFRKTVAQLDIARTQAKLETAQMQSALTPFIRMTGEPNANLQDSYLKNIGSGSAHRISWDYTPHGEPPWDLLFQQDEDLRMVLTTNVLPPNAQESFNPEGKQFRETGVLIKCLSSDDRIFITRIGHRPDGTVIHYHFNISARSD